jgi:hypothetical protein
MAAPPQGIEDAHGLQCGWDDQDTPHASCHCGAAFKAGVKPHEKIALNRARVYQAVALRSAGSIIEIIEESANGSRFLLCADVDGDGRALGD